MRLAPLLLVACQDYDLQAKKDDAEGMEDNGGDTEPATESGDDEVCLPMSRDAEAVPPNDTCDYDIGGFEPIVEWEVDGWSTALPVVGDLDRDGIPEIATIFSSSIIGFAGYLAVYHGDGSGLYWEVPTSEDMSYGSAPALADLDGDGWSEVITIREYQDGLWSAGDYTVQARDFEGNLVWESEHFVEREMDWATGPVVSDMDHDGAPEVVAGQVVLNWDGTTRAVSVYPVRGCPTDPGIEGITKEGAFPAVVDLDLDGDEEVVTGNTMWDADGNILWRNSTYSDGSIGIANLDDDPEGEFVVAWGAQYRAHDTDGRLLWGPHEIRNANILPVPTIGDVDGDGYVEIVVAGGNELRVVNHDGTTLWDHPVTDESGATGASIFDFDADGTPEIVYIDEVEMMAFDGASGAVRFHSTDHASVTMYDYPVIADVDADGHAEIVVMDQGTGLKVYGDATNSWAPVRQVWNQHAYTITNINDDLSVPVDAVPNFTLYNSYHSALSAPPGESLDKELEGEILRVCEDDCDSGVLRVLVRVLNTGNAGVEAGTRLALYARAGGVDTLLTTTVVSEAIPPEMASAGIEVEAPADGVREAEALYLVVDDDGTGTGWIAECLETNNGYEWDGPFCQ